MRTTRHRSTAVIAFLLLAVVLVAILTYQAIDAARSHRVTAENVLGDYAGAAAHELAQRISREFEFYGFYPVFRVLDRLDAGNPLRPLPTLERLTEAARNEEKVAVGVVSTVVRVDLNTSTFVLDDSATAVPACCATRCRRTRERFSKRNGGLRCSPEGTRKTLKSSSIRYGETPPVSGGPHTVSVRI